MPYTDFMCEWCSRLIHNTDVLVEIEGKLFHDPNCADAYREYIRHKKESEENKKPKPDSS